ncbi:MAG TPA: hypothetical protein PKY29_04540 [Ferruginibacter sp.]|nr:hypothetical protein [Ferruginibacter sp.]HRQ20557.1 hypothetical protein [Ferruginibacter sp.]
MGKSKQFKKMRRIASQLPAMNTYAHVTEVVQGTQLIAEGVTEVQGEEVKGTAKYKARKRIVVPMNHAKNMKRNYYQGGKAATQKYINAVVGYHQAKQKKQENNLPSEKPL